MTTTAPPTIETLCATHANENAHTEHVTALALRLWDATHKHFDLPARSRRLLEAAARLHDVAFRDNPQHHLIASAELVRRDGVAGYRPEEWPLIAGIMLFHAGSLAAAENELLALSLTPAQNQLIRQLGAYLRVADGLDYGHVQDAVIRGITVRKRIVRVRVASPLFPANLERAARKADLWRQVFDCALEFQPVEAEGRLLTADLPVAEAARRLITLHTKRLLLHVEPALRGDNPEALRQVRVAVRRLRLLRRVFRKHLPQELADAVDEGLGELGRALGPARDLDVWLEWLQSDATRRALGRHRLWEPLCDHFRRRRALEQAHVVRALRGAHFAALRLKLARLTRAELPARLQESPAKPGALQKLAERRWKKFLKRVRKRAKLRHSSSDEKLHELRVTMRRARYVGEFFAELLTKKEQRRARRLRRVEKLLGRVHDIQMALEHHLPGGPTAPRALTRLLRREQMQLLDQVEALWDKIGL